MAFRSVAETDVVLLSSMNGALRSRSSASSLWAEKLPLELLLGRSLTQQITEQAACPVLWVKEYEEREPFWSALLKPNPTEPAKSHG